MKEQGTLGQWVKEKCKEEHLSLRQAGAKTGLSPSTIHTIIKGWHASAETVTKLARGFGGNGSNQRIALEDELFVLAGYKTRRPSEEKLNVPLAQLIDKEKQLNEPRIKMVTHFVDFLIEIDGGGSDGC